MVRRGALALLAAATAAAPARRRATQLQPENGTALHSFTFSPVFDSLSFNGADPMEFEQFHDQFKRNGI